ncbi:hypothetical protein Ait01nite_049500 [Actinoplanes italicus]|uniref:Uncharacterized protein n=1 Tax=Actinoplanes italicus TaxID=113567 RepID=A0A2T0KA80_9ACTN|nr:hypothetical protein [Actinoplanes italicus]PRX20052.1 hypothetical protein CLV67_109317 [Actinoplanes italicus]GIE31905.1 hypothetical protein Ait01nite_049500 [Actinoplanes italicus]
MSWRQSFREEFRRQTSAETESPPIARVRHYAAVLSIVFGIIGLGGLFSLAVGNISGAQGVSLVLLIAGGVLGGLVLLNSDVVAARRLGLWAAVCTLAGFLAFFLITVLTS